VINKSCLQDWGRNSLLIYLFNLTHDLILHMPFLSLILCKFSIHKKVFFSSFEKITLKHFLLLYPLISNILSTSFIHLRNEFEFRFPLGTSILRFPKKSSIWDLHLLSQHLENHILEDFYPFSRLLIKAYILRMRFLISYWSWSMEWLCSR